MGIYRGPGVVNDGLVFGYDTGYPISDNAVTTRFYKGQPATNLFTVLGTASSSDQNVTFAVNGTGTFKRVAVGTVIGDYKVNNVDVVYSYALGVNGCHYHGNDYSSVSSGTKVSLSVEYFLSPDVGSFDTNYLGNFEQLSGVSGSWGTVSSTKGVWHKVTLTRTATATGNLRMLMYPGGCSSSRLSATGTIYYKNPTVTLTDQPVPFVNGTRSDTASLIDLKRTASIDVSDVSFDSNAQPTFDGTNDKIVIPADSFSNIGTGDFTIDLVFKNTKTSNYSHFFSIKDQYHFALKMQNTSSRSIYVYRTSGLSTYGTINAYAPSTTDYYHLVCKREGDNIELYLNGVSKGTKSGWNNIDIENDTYTTSIGTHGTSSEFTAGEIPVIKLYNRAISATEIKQNYNAYKNRFNI